MKQLFDLQMDRQFRLLKRQYSVAEVLFVQVPHYTRVKDQISTPSDLSVFCYSC